MRNPELTHTMRELKKARRMLIKQRLTSLKRRKSRINRGMLKDFDFFVRKTVKQVTGVKI